MDLVLLNGTIVDGTGRAKYVGDLAISNGRIAQMSNPDGSGRIKPTPGGARTIDCTGLIVSPGWVDVHTHLDAQMTWDKLITPLSAGGVTTAIQGNCGVGFAPCRKQDRTFLMELMEGVEDIPLGSMDAGMVWEWETFPEYMDALRRREFAIDIGTFIAHGPVRAFVLGKRANVSDKPGGPVNDPVTLEEMEQIASVVGDGIRAGAMGFSTSRTLAHRDRSGTLVPGTLATATELLLIGKALGEYGKGKAVFEMASDFQCTDDAKYTPENHHDRLAHFGREFIWMKTMSKGFGVPLCYCLGMPSASVEMSKGFRQMLRNVEAANAEGCRLSTQVFSRPQGILMCWDSRSHPFTECPSFDELRRSAGGLEQHKARLWQDEPLKRRILDEALALARGSTDTGYFGMVLPQSTDDDGPGNLNTANTGKGALVKMYLDNAQMVFPFTNTYSPPASASARAEAQRQGVSPLHVVYDWLCADQGRAVVTHMFMGYASNELGDIQEMLEHPNTVPGLGDTGAHLGFLADPTSPSFLLAHWHRDLGKFPLEFAVKLHSLDTAKVFSLDADRGSLEVGKLADINVIDLANLEIQTPRFVRDLPKAASRWVQHVTGYRYTIKTGVVTFENGQSTGQFPGRVVNGPGYQPEQSASSSSTGAYDGSLFGDVRMALSKLKWEGEQKVLEGLLLVLGPERLERLGGFMNERRPLTASKL